MDIHKLTKEYIQNIESKKELEEVIQKYRLEIDSRFQTMKKLKSMIIEKIDEIKSQTIVLNKNQENDEQKEKVTSKAENRNEQLEKSKTIEDENKETNKSQETHHESVSFDYHTISKEGDRIFISDFEIYQGADITKENEFIIKVETGLEILPTVYLFNAKDEKCGELTIVEEDNKKYMVSLEKAIDYKRLVNSNTCKILAIDKYDHEKAYESEPVSLEVKQLEEFQGILCIDFGTSNTSVGAYFPQDKEKKFVKFQDTLNQNVERETTPTIVYVEDCSEPNHIQYKFGYDAKKAIKLQEYDFNNSIFYEIKKWLINIHKKEKIVDGKLAKTEVERKVILRAYLDYILRKAQNQLKYRFKKLHFSAPIRLKGEYIRSLQEILPEYEVLEKEKCLDEGVAIIYNTYKEEMNSDEEKNTDKKIMIIDIGGGTTDVISSNFVFHESQKGSQVEIKTFPENSNSNFGGNDITYRIFQYLKIKIAKYLQDNTFIQIDELIKMKETNILSSIDDNKSKEEVYRLFETEYAKASEILPTNFQTNKEFVTGKEKRLLKKNFYLLWEAAESIKIKFYESTSVVKIELDEQQNKDIKIPNLDNLVFFIVENNELRKREEILPISISIKEIEKLIYGDAYKIIVDILGDKENNLTNVYRRLKLSGQTCKITLFRELLKEFIPGKQFRDHNNSEDKLKLKCIEGTIDYTSDIDAGVIIPKITSERGMLKNTLKVERNGEIEVLNEKETKILSYADDANNVTINVYDWEGKFVKTEVYNIKKKENKKAYSLSEIVTNCERYEIEEQLKDVDPDTTVILFNPLTTADSFQVVQFYKDNNAQFYLVGGKEYSFEKNTDGSKYFNGEV